MNPDERKLKIVEPEKRTTSQVNFNNEIAQTVLSLMQSEAFTNEIAMKTSTLTINKLVNSKNEEIKSLNQNIEKLINEFKKQTVDENNSSLKISRDFNNEEAIEVKSLDSHISFIVSCTHIASCFKIKTNKGDKLSPGKARKLLEELNLLNNKNFQGKQLTGTKNVSIKYHYSILDEIVNRIKNPNKYEISNTISDKWREVCFIPTRNEIELYIQEIFALFNEK